MNLDREYLDQLVSHTEETKSLFSNPRKHEREGRIARALLRVFDVPFDEEELLVVPEEPVDVPVAGADFQVIEILDEGRQRHRETNERIERCRNASSIEEFVEPIVSGVPTSLIPRPLETDEFVRLISAALEKKERRYGADACGSLDALVYLNIHATVLPPDLGNELLDIPATAAWRSVSVLANDRGLVVAARSCAPRFLRERLSRGVAIWPRPSGLWEP